MCIFEWVGGFFHKLPLAARLKQLFDMEDLKTVPNDKNEELWNKDLLILINSKIKKEFPKYKAIKGKVLKDIFLHKDKNLKYSLQFGFVDQDIIIYDETMDISDLQKSSNILIHKNTTDDKGTLIIPKLICELKYNGINSHGLVIYSDYAADIKAIFPDCKYFLALRFKRSSTPNKLFRHGKNFDKIIAFDNGRPKGSYVANDFLSQIKVDKDLKGKFEEFIEEIKNVLRIKKSHFIK